MIVCSHYLILKGSKALSQLLSREKPSKSKVEEVYGGDNKSNCLPIVNKNRLSQEKALLPCLLVSEAGQ